MNELPHVTIYTDGACRGNPGPGGWAALLRFDFSQHAERGTREKVLQGSERETTNNRMELTAAIHAFKVLKEPCQVDLHTDSEYLKRGISEWLPTWRERNWRRKKGKLANVDLWKALDQAIQGHDIQWHWVRGHAGDRDNQRVDRLARRAIPK